MKIEVHYYELKKKEFRSKKSLKKFLNTKLDHEILRAVEVKDKTYTMLELQRFIYENKYE